jgi:hypothetical protein
MEYTKDDVIQELRDFCTKHKTKERHIVDRRNYLIALLYYKFSMVETEIVLHTNLTSRSTINHAKRSGYELYMTKDKGYLKNIKSLVIKYPCQFDDTNVKTKTYLLSTTISVSLSHHYFSMLNNYMQVKNIDKPDDAVKKLLKSTLKLWEE